MDKSQNMSVGKMSETMQRPGILTLLAVLMGLAAIPEACLGSSSLTFLARPLGIISFFVLAITFPIISGLYGYAAWGLWNLKNWSRYLSIGLIIFSFFTLLLQFTDSYKDHFVIIAIQIILYVVIGGVAIYWLLRNGKYFGGTYVEELQKTTVEKRKKLPNRPRMVTLFVFIVGLAAIPNGFAAGALPLVFGASKQIATLLMFILFPLVTGFYAYVAWGLWNLKDWSRYALIGIVALDFFISLPTLAKGYDQSPAATILLIALSFALRAAAIYWFLQNGKYFTEQVADYFNK